MRVLTIILLFSLVLTLEGYAQKEKECKVLLLGLDESYSGDCKKGLAHGEGIASGSLGTYKGHFRKGFPNGQGRIEYKRDNIIGAYYEGEWSRGKREGKGVYYHSRDSIVEGYWNDDVYIGKYPYPYKVVSAQSIPRYKFVKNNKALPNIEVQFRRNGVKNTSDIVVMNIQASSGTEVRDQNYLSFDNVQFPFECRLSLTVNNSMNTNQYTADFNFIIYEESSWIIIIDY